MSVATCKHGTPAFQPCRDCDDETDKITIIAERDRLRADYHELNIERDRLKQYENACIFEQEENEALCEEIYRLRAELAEARKPDCRFCCFRFPLKDTCAIDDCVDGSRYKAFGPAVLAPVRLYEKEWKV